MIAAIHKLGLKFARTLWPSGLGGRTILVLSVAVVLVHLSTVLLYHDEGANQADAVFASQVAGRLATATQALMDTDIARRDSRAHALVSPGLDLHWSDHATVAPTVSRAPALPKFQQRLAVLAPDLGEVALQFASRGSMDDAAMVEGSVRLPDATFLNFSATLPGSPSRWRGHTTLISTTLMALGVVGVAALLMRGLTRPLRRLAIAADAIGHGPDVKVVEAGPQEVRHVARAFNAMQGRIHRLVDDRTEALAAVSHDLRTPITRLRLRAGFLDDQEMQGAIDSDLDEMEAMIEATLAYMRGDFESEPRQVTDLAALLSTLVDQASDAGAAASFHGPNHVPILLHPSLIKRAFANLVNNAVTYGGCARVTLAALPTGVCVTIEDDGPGIPGVDLERVFQPFQRLDSARTKGSGGVGLGLAIARRAIEYEQGRVRLINRAEGGLRAEVLLPLLDAAMHVLPAPADSRSLSRSGPAQSSTNGSQQPIARIVHVSG